MRIVIAAVGRLKQGPERALVERYVERARATGRALGITDVDILECADGRAVRADDRKAEEAALLRDKLREAVLVAFDEHGKTLDSVSFAALVAQRRDFGTRDLAFVIGGADGLDPTLVAQAEAVIALGRMTIPHQIVRILAAEQVYRAMTILAGHPYHRA